MEGALVQTSMPEHLSISALASYVATGHLDIDIPETPESVVDFLAHSACQNILSGPDFDLPAQEIEYVPMLLDVNETVPPESCWSINALAESVPGGEQMPEQSVCSAESVHSNSEVRTLDDEYDVILGYRGAESVYSDPVVLSQFDFNRDGLMNLDVPQFDLPEWSQCPEPNSNNGENFTISDNGLDQLVLEEPMSTDSGVAQLGSGSSDYGPAGTLLESAGASKLPAGIGVTYHSTNEKYEAHLWLAGRQLRNMRKKKGVQLYLGHFATADEAKRAHDKAALKIRKTARGRGKGKAYPLNFPESDYTNYLGEHSGWSERDFLWKIRRSSLKFSKGRSSMKGVTVRTSTRKGVETVAFEAKISRKTEEGSKQFKLGMFESEEAAGMAYDRAQLYLNGPDELTCITNFRPSDYSDADIQAAGMMLKSQYSYLE